MWRLTVLVFNEPSYKIQKLDAFFLDDHYFCEATSICLEGTLYGFTVFSRQN